MADVWQWTPFIFVILLAGLAAIPDSLYEAADLDGAKPFQAFRFVTLPLLLPIILIAVTFRLIDAAKMFDIIFSLTRGGPGTDTYTTTYFLYQQGFELFHLGQGTAGAWMFTQSCSHSSRSGSCGACSSRWKRRRDEHRRRPRPVGAEGDSVVRGGRCAGFVRYAIPSPCTSPSSCCPLYWMAVTSIKSRDVAFPTRPSGSRPTRRASTTTVAQSLQRLEGARTR